jgi:drug/metabolite transporter (DMT)-like permease
MTRPAVAQPRLAEIPSMSLTLRHLHARVPPSLGLPTEFIGLGAGFAAATIWGATLAVTRLGVGAEAATLGPHDLVLLRFLGPALLLLPIALRVLPRFSRRDIPVLLALFVGGGAPFVLLVGAALGEASAADAGALLPGTVPLWVAAASSLLGGQGPRGFGLCQGGGLLLIALAVALVAGPAAFAGEGWLGPALLLAASCMSACYTLALRAAGLTPFEATAIVSLTSMLAFAPLYWLGMSSGLHAATWTEIAVQAAWQGGLSGLLAPVAFAVAVARLGAARAAAFGALSPVAAAVFGLLLLDEVPDAFAALGLGAAALGVALATRPASTSAGGAQCLRRAPPASSPR